MSNLVETILQPESALDHAASVQARAFFDDPVFTWVFPDVEERRGRLPWLMRVGVSLGMRFGEVHTTRDAMLGHAVWLPPGDTHVDAERLAAAGFLEPDTHIGVTALTRFDTFMEQMSPHHERLVPEPHWYLMILDVDPPHQGRCYGGTLLQPVLTRADREARSCYLETAKEGNLALYRKHGFEVVAEDVLHGDGPRVWMMVRKPRAAA
jgi:ribosomal protein S18 acetylase RimI-like enzyme